jgi:hypothetical protein
MSIETLDLTLDTRTELPENFTCDCEILILSLHLTELPSQFLYKNEYVKTLDMSNCTNITVIQCYFCIQSCVENIIWPPNIKIIQSECLSGNIYIRKIDLSYCNQLTYISGGFCRSTNIVDIILPASIRNIDHSFCAFNKALTQLDISYCIHLIFIGSGFCAYSNIQSIRFPKFLKEISHTIGYKSEFLQELDFSECKDIKINTFNICNIITLKLYSIDNIATAHKIHCENLHIYNITETKYLDLSSIEGLQNVYLPEGEYCIANIQSKEYSNIKCWLRDSVYPIAYFSTLKWYSYLPVQGLVVADIHLDTI